MVKGINRKVIEVTNIDSDYFEKAILFMKSAKQDAEMTGVGLKAKEYIRQIDLMEHSNHPPAAKPKRKTGKAGIWLGFVQICMAAAAGAAFMFLLMR